MILRCFIILSLLFNDARSGVNVALNKAVNGSSVYDNDPANGFYRVTDGATDHSCMTHMNENSWLMIDLVDLYVIVRVTLMNIFNPVACQDYFIVGMTNIGSNVKAPLTTSDYFLCAQYSGTLAALEVGTVHCSPHMPLARYVVIKKGICTKDCVLGTREVEVYVAKTKTVISKKKSESRFISKPFTGFSTAIKSSQTYCMEYCLQNDCDSFNYYVLNGTCEINFHPTGYKASDVEPALGWDWWLQSYYFEEQ